MRLISQTRDYYDPMFYLDHDSPDIFKREPVVFYIEPKPPAYPRFMAFPEGDFVGTYERFIVKSGLIGFCGRFFPFFDVRGYKTRKRRDEVVQEEFVEYIYSVEELYRKFPSFQKKALKAPSHFSARNIRSVSQIEAWLNDCSVSGLFCEKKNVSRPFRWIFEKHQAAYFCVRESGWRFEVQIYPILKDLMFYRVFPLEQAAQEIEMYLTNQLAKPDSPNIQPVPDDIKAQSKGFDKFSFRKEKSK